MKKVIAYFKSRNKARKDYQHLSRMPDRILDDLGIKRDDIDKIIRGK